MGVGGGVRGFKASAMPEEVENVILTVLHRHWRPKNLEHAPMSPLALVILWTDTDPLFYTAEIQTKIILKSTLNK